MLIDLHVHTVRGSSDSSLKTDEMVEEAVRAGLDGVCFTEHRGPWDRHELEALQQRHEGLLLLNAMEVETSFGHLTVFGLDRFVGGIHDPVTLRRIADEQGAFVVLAHPFRYFLGLPERNLLYREQRPIPSEIEEITTHPAFALVDAIEVHNGGTSAAENAVALEVARYLGKPTVGGSDAHSTHGLGQSVTVFDDPIASARDFMEALHASKFHAAVRTPDGALTHALGS
jgi:predicted metal-dependent phosphoesterase TrpH